MFLEKPIIAGQPYEKLQKLIEKQTFLSTVFYGNVWQKSLYYPIQKPEMNVVFQLADTTLMHTQANNLWHSKRGYVLGPNHLRGTRHETFYALNDKKDVLATLSWVPGDNELFAKDIFILVKPKEVDRKSVV